MTKTKKNLNKSSFLERVVNNWKPYLPDIWLVARSTLISCISCYIFFTLCLMLLPVPPSNDTELSGGPFVVILILCVIFLYFLFRVYLIVPLLISFIFSAFENILNPNTLFTEITEFFSSVGKIRRKEPGEIKGRYAMFLLFISNFSGKSFRLNEKKYLIRIQSYIEYFIFFLFFFLY